MASDDEAAAAVRVLIATPRPVLAEGLQILLSDLGWSVLPITKKLSALLKHVKLEQPKLILLDADWPEELVLLSALRSLTEQQPAAKAVLLYETLEPTQRMRALLAVCTAIVDCRQPPSNSAVNSFKSPRFPNRNRGRTRPALSVLGSSRRKATGL